MKEKLINFNKNNSQYRINIKDYSAYDTMEDYTQGLTRLNADIVSGDVADIMVLSSQMPVESYISKGIFEDLTPYLEKDTEVKKEDFAVWEAASPWHVRHFICGRSPAYRGSAARERYSFRDARSGAFFVRIYRYHEAVLESR